MKVKFYSIIMLLLLVAVYFFRYDGIQEHISNENRQQVIQEPETSNTSSLIKRSVVGDQTQVIPNQCNDLIELLEPQVNWYQKKQLIQDLLVQLDESNVSRKVIDQVLIDAGIGISRGHRFLRGDDLKNVTSLVGEDTGFINFEQRKLIAELLQDSDVEKLLSLYINGHIPQDKMILLGQKLYSPVQLFLTILKKQPDEDIEAEAIIAINELMAVKVPVYFSDLIESTTKGFSVVILQLLNDHYVGDTNQVFYYQENIHTLATLAAQSEIVESAGYWLAEGVTPSPLKYRENALDYVAKINDAPLLESFVSLLLKYGIIPNKKNTSLLIKQKLSGEYLQSHPEVIAKFDYQSLSKHEKDIRDEAVSNIFSKAIAGLKDDGACLSSFKLKKKFVGNIFSLEDKEKSEQELLAVNFDSSKFEQQLQLLRQKELEKYEVDKSSEKSNELIATPKQQKTTKRVAQLLKQGDWQTALAERLEYVELSEQEQLNVSFVFALLANADSQQLITLIEQGAEINPNLFATIIDKCDLEVLQSLYRHGYDFHFVDSMGNNAITAAVGGKKLNSLNFLLNIGVTPDPATGLNAPLSKAISELYFYPEDIRYVDALVNGGATITDFHKQYVASFAKKKKELYTKLVTLYPQLKI
ncbi:hypothetical protein [Thalassomonas actiniarum]|uniref:Ankyrin n=1 Tax=Thalassomonas actiniarum TaxID=485447 RepID=A0AAE9YNW4_9GAMM|nr:hypothetical protein [Thalassomonas actiniarum]WDD98495.1 hypothetical protein SG35_025115 [Thalassomonas actiniarum]